MQLSEIKTIYQKELKGIYPLEEIDSIFFRCTAHYLNLERFILLVQPNYTVTKTEEKPLFEALTRLKTNEPVQHILGQAYFMDLTLEVNEHTLIPRPETEELVQWILDDNRQKETKEVNILDMGTGSGCIAIACAYAFEHAKVDASDISADALAVAEINRRDHGLEDRVQLLESDLFESIPGKRYDIIVSNPPYVSLQEMAELPAEFMFEPGASALAAGETGMDIVLPMLVQARDYLTDDGILVVEVGYSKPALEALLPEVPFFWVDFEFGA